MQDNRGENSALAQVCVLATGRAGTHSDAMASLLSRRPDIPRMIDTARPGWLAWWLIVVAALVVTMFATRNSSQTHES